MDIHLFSFNLKLAFILAFVFLFILPAFIIKRKRFLIGYLIIYLCLLILGVFFKVSISNGLIHFGLLITNKWFNNTLVLAALEPLTVIINLFLCFPIGFVIPALFNKTNIFRVLLIGFLFSFSIEFLQFTLPILRSPELLDVINNTISVLLGFIYFNIIKKVRTNLTLLKHSR